MQICTKFLHIVLIRYIIDEEMWREKYMDYGKFKILIVDDVQEVLDATAGNIEVIEAQAITEINPEKALEFLKTNKVDLILLDYFMPEMSGEEFVNKLREFDKNTVIYLHTGYADEIPSDEMMKKLNIQRLYK